MSEATSLPGGPASGIDTSILVTTFRRPRHLALVLESIALQRRVPRDFEVIVADDGSGDATAEVVQEELGYSFRPLEDTVEDAWDWFVTRGYAGEARQRTALAR